VKEEEWDKAMAGVPEEPLDEVMEAETETEEVTAAEVSERSSKRGKTGTNTELALRAERSSPWLLCSGNTTRVK
jgi:hypothetical protein